MRHLTLWLAAACALGALAASASSAALPELGRCIKLEGTKEPGQKRVFTGKYTNRKCTAESPSSTGKFEWFPGTKAGGEEWESGGPPVTVKLETAQGRGIECAKSKMVGKYTSSTTSTSELKLEECLENTTKQFCTNEVPEKPENPGEIQILKQTVNSQPLEGKLGYIKKAGTKPQVGWEYKAQSGPDVFVFECGQVYGSGRKFTVEGAYIGEVWKPIDRMSEEESFVRYHGQLGKQSPESFEGGPKATLTVNIMNLETLEFTTEALSFGMALEEQETEEPLEIKAL